MFSSLKLNSLKCQSNSASEKKKEKYNEDEDDVSEHMYEKLPNYDSKTCKCHSNYISRSPKSLKTSVSKRINKCKLHKSDGCILELINPSLILTNYGCFSVFPIKQKSISVHIDENTPLTCGHVLPHMTND